MNVRRPRIRFAPARLKARHDGWTPERQIRFIDELAASRCISRACRAARMSGASAYKLRDRPDAADFARAWRKALTDEPAERTPSTRTAARRQRIAETRKVSELHEMHGPPDPTGGSEEASPTLRTFQALLAQLRGAEG